MTESKGPVIVTLSCEANPQQDTVEIDRTEWDAMTPAQRAEMLYAMTEDHINNSGGGGWWIDDPDDAAEAEGPDEPTADPLRELAEWLVSLDDPDDDAGMAARRTVTLDQIITRAREALGRE